MKKTFLDGVTLSFKNKKIDFNKSIFPSLFEKLLASVMFPEIFFVTPDQMKSPRVKKIIELLETENTELYDSFQDFCLKVVINSQNIENTGSVPFWNPKTLLKIIEKIREENSVSDTYLNDLSKLSDFIITVTLLTEHDDSQIPTVTETYLEYSLLKHLGVEVKIGLRDPSALPSF